jgi:DNA-binding protein H-NS
MNGSNDMISVSAGASYEELRAAQDVLNAEIGKLATAARAEGLSKMVSLINEFKFTSDELNKAISGKGKPGRKAKIKGVDSLAPKAKRVGKKALPKYRNGETGAMWTGRGVAPAWIKAHAKETWDQFLIPAAELEAMAASMQSQPLTSTPVADVTSAEVPAYTADEPATEVAPTQPLFATAD